MPPEGEIKDIVNPRSPVPQHRTIYETGIGGIIAEGEVTVKEPDLIDHVLT